MDIFYLHNFAYLEKYSYLYFSFPQKKKVQSAQDLEKIINDVLKSSEKTMLIAIYNNDNQRRYIGVKLD